jgi:hypothetical protein
MKYSQFKSDLAQKKYQRLKSDLLKIKNALVLAATVPRFLRKRITFEQAEEQTRRLLASRVERFLELARTQIYECPGNAYLRLLKHAGCEFSDLQTHVYRHGLEETLIELAKQGVYLTSDEFKGHRDVIRGQVSFRVFPREFQRRVSTAGFTIQSSGTRNAPVSTFSQLDWRILRLMALTLTYTANGIFSSAYAQYQPILSGRAGSVLTRGKIGIPTDRWFAPKIQINNWLETKYHYLTAYLIAVMGNWFGPGIAKPEFLEIGEVRPIVEWILQKRRDGKTCCINAVHSICVRIAQVASEMGVSLEGTTFLGHGEPLTQFKRALIEKAGARVFTNYSLGGNINAGLGCGKPAFTDEVHVHQSLLALVEHPKPIDSTRPPIYPLLATTLHPLAPRLLLNVANGDYATFVKRDCGCALERIGFTQHLHTIRSFEKFTSEGMNYFIVDLFELLEKTIPSEFGGGSGDYQLVEEEDGNGQTRLTLVVHPEVRMLNEEKLLARLRAVLAQGSRGNRFMTKLWHDEGTFRVIRKTPYASPRGKILPLHILHKKTMPLAETSLPGAPT